MLEEGNSISLLIQAFSLNLFFFFYFVHHLPSLPFAYGLTWLLKGLQEIEFTVAGSKAKDLCDVPKMARTPEPSTSDDPPSSKRHWQMPSAMASDPTA